MRQQLALATPACGAPLMPLYTGMTKAPLPGTTFGLTATNAPPNAPGVLALGTPLLPPLPILNAQVLGNPVLMINATSDSSGFSRCNLAVPPALPPLLSWGLSAQWVFLTNAACPGTGLLGASERLDF